MAGRSTALKHRDPNSELPPPSLPTWAAGLTTIQQAKFVEALEDPEVITVTEAGKRAGFSDSTLKSTVYQLVSRTEITHARQAFRLERSDNARALMRLGEQGMLTAYGQLEGPRDKFAAAEKIAAHGLEKARISTDPEHDQRELSDALQRLRDTMRRGIRMALRCGLERPEVARRILERRRK